MSKLICTCERRRFRGDERLLLDAATLRFGLLIEAARLRVPGRISEILLYRWL
jgi:hypothetical protein